MLRRIHIDGLVPSAMHPEVGLLVTFQIVPTKHHAALDGIFVNARGDCSTAPCHSSRSTDLYRKQFHDVLSYQYSPAESSTGLKGNRELLRGRCNVCRLERR